MMQISASKIQCYLDCPEKYRWRYVEKVEPEETPASLVMGGCVHRVIGYYYRSLMDGRQLLIEKLLDTFREEWGAALCAPVAFNGQPPEQLEAQGIDLIQCYLEATADSTATPVAVEAEFRLPVMNLVTGESLEGVQLLSYIDRIDPGDEIVELKTSARSWNELQARQSIQMGLYCYVLAYHLNLETVQGKFEVLVKNKAPKLQILRTNRSRPQFDQLYRLLREVIHSIEDRLYYPRPTYMCGTCDYLDICEQW